MRTALICDYPEEGWLSMDLCAQMLFNTWHRDSSWQLKQICPPFQRRLMQLPMIGKGHTAFNSDRLLNRFWDYPRFVQQQVAKQFDVFHVCDHTYAQLVHELPAARTGVYCHDIDAFRSLVEPEQEPRPRWYRAMSQRILDGLQKAAIVFYSTAEVRRQIEHYQLVDRDRLVHAPLGVAPEFTPKVATLSPDARSLLDSLGDQPFILHVGSCIPRKRVDVLLAVFAQLRDRHPRLRLVKVSGEWTADQQQQIEQLGIRSSIDHWQNLSRPAIAALYRQASAVLLTSEAEGFGLPLVEALSCGAIAIVSDLPVLREVAGEAALYCPVSEISTWVKTIDAVLTDANQAPEKTQRLEQAARYSWQAHTQAITQAYLRLGAG